jgi:hypothetical protein
MQSTLLLRVYDLPRALLWDAWWLGLPVRETVEKRR